MEVVLRFLKVIQDDPRIHPTHICLYLALFRCWVANKMRNPLELDRTEVMEMSKIGGRATYQKCISELKEFGYILYEPGFNRYRKTKVSIIPI